MNSIKNIKNRKYLQLNKTLNAKLLSFILTIYFHFIEKALR